MVLINIFAGGGTGDTDVENRLVNRVREGGSEWDEFEKVVPTYVHIVCKIDGW